MESVAGPLKIMHCINIEKLLILFNYDPLTGIVIRAISYGNAIKGQEFQGHRLISVHGVNFSIATVAWTIHNKIWPPKGYWIDHIDRDKTNNKITNLRLATPTQNQQNKAGYGFYAKGVTWRDRKQKPWQAKIRVNGVRIHLGSFATEREASEAYMLAALEHHGEFACLV